MNNPISLDLARRFGKSWHDADYGLDPDERIAEALAAHLPELAACHYREVDVEVIERMLASDRFAPTPVSALAKRIAAALSDATNGGHWEECDHSTFYSDEAKRGRRRGTYENYSIVAYERWVPANPDAALLAIVDADTLARLREVAEVTAR